MNKHAIAAMSRLFNTPLLIREDALEAMLACLDLPGLAFPAAGDLAAFGNAGREPKEKDALAVIPVYGPLTYRPDDGFLAFLFGSSSSYEAIRKQFRAALEDPAFKAIVFDIASPGGESAGLFDLVDEIYQARGQKPLYAVANETAYSAAYAIASAADRIFLPRTGGVGSVGVIAMHRDQSQWDEKLGFRYTPIYAGARKNDFSAHEPLTAEALALAQAQVDDLYGLFVETVARNRNLTTEAVRATQAGLFRGRAALTAGFADALKPWSLAFNTIHHEIRRNGGARQMTIKQQLENLLRENAEETVSALAEIGYVPRESASHEEPEDTVKIASEAATKARKEALEEVMRIIEACDLADRPKLAGTLIAEGVTVEEACARLAAEKAKDAERDTIRSTVGAVSTGEVNPLLADARKRASAVPGMK